MTRDPIVALVINQLRVHKLDSLVGERVASSRLADAVEVHAHVAPGSFLATRVVHQSGLRRWDFGGQPSRSVHNWLVKKRAPSSRMMIIRLNIG